MFGDVVVDVDHEHFEEAFDKIKLKYNAQHDTDVPFEGMIELCKAYQASLSPSSWQVVPARPARPA